MRNAIDAEAHAQEEHLLPSRIVKLSEHVGLAPAIQRLHTRWN